MDEFHSYMFALLSELQEICGRRHKTCNTVTIYDSIETQSSQVFSNIVLQMLSLGVASLVFNFARRFKASIRRDIVDTREELFKD